MSASLPFISVVVPAYNRKAGLEALLEALGEQSYPPYRFEVLICDDGSTPPLVEQLSVKDLPFSASFSRDSNRGPATARNRGVARARGVIVAFTDDDCVPTTGWLEAIAKAMDTPTTYAVHGPTFSSVPPIDPFIHSLHIDERHGVATANFAVRKDRLLAVGGFDEVFRRPYFEDEDLSRRLQRQFGPITWSEEVRVEHPPRPAPFFKAFKAAGYFYYLPYMQRKHAGYWSGAVAANVRRAALKALIVLVGSSPVLGAPLALSSAWLVLLAWQGKRLQRQLARVVAHGQRVSPVTQLAFLLFEWLLDFVRVLAYLRGLALRPKPASLGLEELL